MGAADALSYAAATGERHRGASADGDQHALLIGQTQGPPCSGERGALGATGDGDDGGQLVRVQVGDGDGIAIAAVFLGHQHLRAVMAPGRCTAEPPLVQAGEDGAVAPASSSGHTLTDSAIHRP